MSASESRRLRIAVFVTFFLLVIGTIATLSSNLIVWPGSVGISRQLAETPIFSFLPRWLLDRWAVPISREGNARVLKNVFEVLDPSLRSFLASVPIIFDSSADTAKAYPAKGYIGVSPDWDNTVGQSKYSGIYQQRGMKPDDPVFTPRFKTELLIHELLHVLQVHLQIDSGTVYKAVEEWYKDPRYGRPSPNGIASADTANGKRPDTVAANRIKYILWHQLYNYRNVSDVPQDESWKNMRYEGRYRSAEKGVEEFAYIGQEILSSGSNSANYIKTGEWSDQDWKSKKMRLMELSPEVLAFFKAVFNPALMQ